VFYPSVLSLSFDVLHAWCVQATPSKIERQEDGKLKVTWTSNGEESSDVFDTVLSAIGE